MLKIDTKRNKLLTFIFIFILLITQIIGGVSLARAEEVQYDFDNTNALSDLESSKDFNISDYPFDLSGKKKTPEMVNFVEWGYSKREDKKDAFALYIYFYNPTALNINTESTSNKIEMRVNQEAFEKYNLLYINKSEEKGVEGLFYKFRVIDHAVKYNGANSYMKDRLNSIERVYEISGLELMTSKVIEYTVGGKYKFTGYAAGYGSNEYLPSTLECTYSNKTETIALDVHSTNYLTGTSSAGAYHRGNLSSVYFAVPEKYFTEYGVLQKIKAEWYEYKTKPILVINNETAYNNIYQNRGNNNITCDKNLGYGFYEGRSVSNSAIAPGALGLVIKDCSYFGYSYNAPLFNGINIVENNISPLHWVFKGDNEEVSPEEMKAYAEDYTSQFGGATTSTSTPLSKILFENTVDEGRTVGYNVQDIDAGESINLLSYSETHTFWEKLFDYGLFGGEADTSTGLSDVSPIEVEQIPEFMTQNDNIISSSLFIKSDDVSSFKSFYNTSKTEGKKTVLFRFALTDYYSHYVYVDNFNDTIFDTDKKDAYFAQKTLFLDFDIIQLTFCKNGVYKDIPVVSNPADIYEGVSAPQRTAIEDFFNDIFGEAKKTTNKALAWVVLVASVIVGIIALVIVAKSFKLLSSGSFVLVIIGIIIIAGVAVGAYFGITWILQVIENFGGLVV